MIYACFDICEELALRIPPFLGSDLEQHVMSINNLKRRAQSAVAWGLAVYAAGGVFDVEFDRGAPKRLDGQFVSVTHGADGAAALVSNKPCGIDLEQIRKPYPVDVVARFLGTAAVAKISAATNPDHMFCLLWTLRECAIKMQDEVQNYTTFDVKQSVLTACGHQEGAQLRIVTMDELFAALTAI